MCWYEYSCKREETPEVGCWVTPVFQVQGALGQSCPAGDLRRLGQPAKEARGSRFYGVAALVRVSGQKGSTVGKWELSR
jgi:hypothetical protein